jgi:transposase InsO family protein
MKRRNRTWGCKRIAQQIALAFGVDIDKDVVRRILAIHFHPEAGSGGPSWLSLIGHAKDSLWSLDLFRCESAILRTYWVLVVMDQFTRRIVGFAVHRGVVDGAALCRMFNRAIHAQTLPKYLSSDHDPLYRFHQWQANLRVLEIQEIKTVPYVPLSHPFVERLIGTIRREYLDQTLFWTAADFENKLGLFQAYFNQQRVHSGLEGRLPDPDASRTPLNFSSYRWQQHCRASIRRRLPRDFEQFAKDTCPIGRDQIGHRHFEWQGRFLFVDRRRLPFLSPTMSHDRYRYRRIR